MQGVIYKLTNRLNDKVYIGQTINLKRRLAHHLYASKSIEHANGKYPISLAIAKFGFEAFDCTILWKSKISEDKEAIKKELDEKERYFIKEYDSVNKGYNQTYGGGGLLGYTLPPESLEKVRQGNLGKKLPEWLKEENIKRFAEFRKDPKFLAMLSKRMTGVNNPMYGKHLKGKDSHMYGKHLSKETKKKISEAKLGKKGTPMSEKHRQKLRDIMTGVPKSKEHKEKLSKANLGKKHTERRKVILQYDINGDFVKEWECAFDAEKIYNDNHINDCCRGIRKLAAGYQWRFKTNNYPIKIEAYINPACRKIEQIDEQGNILRTFSSIKEIIENINISRSCIQDVLKGKQKSTKGFYFRYG